MRILLQNFETGLYLAGDGSWTQKHEAALAFRDEVRATEFRLQHRLDQAFVVVRPEPSSAREPLTIVEAELEVGQGNALFIRGEGEGLSWSKGQPLSRFDGSRWIWSSHSSGDKVVFKLLLNDSIWAQGEDIVVRAGRRVELSPVFS
jgi:hypothetical protein